MLIQRRISIYTVYWAIISLPYTVISAIKSYADYIQDTMHHERAHIRVRTESRAQAFLAWGEERKQLLLLSKCIPATQAICRSYVHGHKRPKFFLNVIQQLRELHKVLSGIQIHSLNPVLCQFWILCTLISHFSQQQLTLPILPDNLRELNQMTEWESKLRKQAEWEILLGQLQLQK